MKILKDLLINVDMGDVRQGELVIPESVTRIGDGALSYCTGLTRLTLPGGLTHIGVRGLLRCRGLTSLALPGSLTHIGSGALRDCTGLTHLTLPDSLTHIGYWALYGCSGLTSLTVQGKEYKTLCMSGGIVIMDCQYECDQGVVVYVSRLFLGMREGCLQLRDCFIVERDGRFASGDTLQAAVSELQRKLERPPDDG